MTFWKIRLAWLAVLGCSMAGCGGKAEDHMAPVFAFVALNTPEVTSSPKIQESLASFLSEMTSISDLKIDAQAISFGAGRES